MVDTERRQPTSRSKKHTEDSLTPSLASELSQQLFELVYSTPKLEQPEFERGLAALEERYRQAVYPELLHLLCHLRFEPEEAKRHWRKILAHRERMAESLDTTVDVRVALVSYFLDSEPLLESPTVIELRLLESARNFAFRDSLTGLYNYRFFREFLPHELWRADQYNTPLSLVVADIDDFKLYNDRFGHEEGNIALSRIAVLLEESLRKVDVAIRYGGEEFVLILPATPKVGAQIVAERARRAVEREEMHRGERLTLSMGIATYPADADSERDLLRHADRSMYLAKAKGKNLVEIFGNDRRSFTRVSAVLNGEFRQMGLETHPLETLDVSGGGLRFRSDRSMPLGSLVDVDLLLSRDTGSIRLAGRVVDSKEAELGRFEVAVRIVDIGNEDRHRLGGYLRAISTPSPVDG